jgi:hypothetical protein
VHRSVPEKIEDVIDPEGALEVWRIVGGNCPVVFLPRPYFFTHVEGVTEFGAVDPLKQVLPILLNLITLTESQIMWLYNEVFEHIFWKPFFAPTALLPLKREFSGWKNIIDTCVFKLLEQPVI